MEIGALNWVKGGLQPIRLLVTRSATTGVGAGGRIRAAPLPSRKSQEDFDFDHQRSVKRETISHLGTLDFVVGKENVIFLGPPGTGMTHLAPGLGIRACQAGHRFATAAQ